MPDERERFKESEDFFYRRILRTVEQDGIPGMEKWNIKNAADMLRRMWAAYQQSK